MPASMRAFIPSTESQAGPSVQMSFARRMAMARGEHPATGNRRQAIAWIRRERRCARAGAALIPHLMATTRRPDGTLTLGGVSLAEIARDPRFGTPAYVYDLDAITDEARALDAAFESAPHLVA